MVYGVWCMVDSTVVIIRLSQPQLSPQVMNKSLQQVTTAVIIRPSQPSIAGVGAGAELGKNKDVFSGH